MSAVFCNYNHAGIELSLRITVDEDFADRLSKAITRVEIFRGYDAKGNALSVDVYNHCSFGSQEPKAEVNWSGCGSQTPAVAVEYAAMIALAADLANRLVEFTIGIVGGTDTNASGTRYSTSTNAAKILLFLAQLNLQSLGIAS